MVVTISLLPILISLLLLWSVKNTDAAMIVPNTKPMKINKRRKHAGLDSILILSNF